MPFLSDRTISLQKQEINTQSQFLLCPNTLTLVKGIGNFFIKIILTGGCHEKQRLFY
jgi:hypothetical protein